MTLQEMIKKLIPSNRLIVATEDGEELYRGYAANWQYSKDKINAPVVKFGIYTDTFRRNIRESRLMQTEKQLVEVDNYTDFAFTDLEIVIYTKITIKK